MLGLASAAHGDIVSEGANPAAVLDKAHRASPIQDGGAGTGAAGEPVARGGHAAAALRGRSDPRRDRFAGAPRPEISWRVGTGALIQAHPGVYRVGPDRARRGAPEVDPLR